MATESSKKKKDDNSKPDHLLPAEFEADPLEEVLSAKLGEIVSGPQKREVTRVVHEVFSSFQGPLPHPSLLDRYDEISPGAAERIIAMAEKEQAHRHSWEQRALSAESWYGMVGLLAGWTTAIALAGGAALAAAFGEPAVGVALAAASATGMVWKLVQGRSDRSEQATDAPKQDSKAHQSRGRSKRR
jgi:uncharacterized membrane protein